LGILLNIIGIPLLLISFQKKFPLGEIWQANNIIFVNKVDVGGSQHQQ
jgi:hypothetical protein